MLAGKSLNESIHCQIGRRRECRLRGGLAGLISSNVVIATSRPRIARNVVGDHGRQVESRIKRRAGACQMKVRSSIDKLRVYGFRVRFQAGAILIIAERLGSIRGTVICVGFSSAVIDVI